MSAYLVKKGFKKVNWDDALIFRKIRGTPNLTFLWAVDPRAYGNYDLLVGIDTGPTCFKKKFNGLTNLERARHKTRVLLSNFHFAQEEFFVNR